MCGTAVEPLRAREILLFEDGFRFLCDAECRRLYGLGERNHENRPPPSRPLPGRKRAPTPPPPMPRSLAPSADRSAAHRALGAPLDGPPLLGLGAAVLGLVLSAFGTHTIVAALVGLSVIGAAGAALALGWKARAEVGWLGWALPPVGALLAAAGAMAVRPPNDPRLWLAGAALAGGAVVLRAWLDARASQPVDEIVRALADKMPARVRVSQGADEWAVEVPWEEVPAIRVRAGQEVLVGEGEVVGVDGVVQAGESYALLHPSSRTPVRRVAGDPVLAGAVLTEGEIRVLATRVRDERALIRPKTFATLAGKRSAAITHFTARALRWGGGVTLVVAAVGAFAASGLAAELACVAAVLLASPLIAVRRASEGPYVATAATAVERGIAFAHARALDQAGRTSVAALCTHGTITNGEPEVVEIHAVDDAGPWEPVVALVAGAEAAAAEEHPIAGAVTRFCEHRGITPTLVRRTAFLPGRGVTAMTEEGEELVVGNRGLLLEEGVSVAVAEAEATRAEERGHTVVFVGLDGRTRAALSLRDEDRVGARAAVQRLMDLSIEVVLLSGDHRGTVEALAKHLDVTHVKAELLPEERGPGVEHLRETSGLVAAIGRPSVDAEALEAADVPVALGAAGSVEGERGIALTGSDVRDAAAALWLARAARRAARRGTLLAAVGGAALTAAGALGIAAPAVVAMGALAIDAYALPSAMRLLRRIELRLPARG